MLMKGLCFLFVFLKVEVIGDVAVSVAQYTSGFFVFQDILIYCIGYGQFLFSSSD